MMHSKKIVPAWQKGIRTEAGSAWGSRRNVRRKACYIIALLDKKAADKSAFERDKENVTKRYLYEKQETFLTDWQSDISQHMEIYTKFQ